VWRKPQSVLPIGVSEWSEGRVRRHEDTIVGEEPLEIRLGTSPLTVTMRTPGDDLELAAGLLFTEGIVCRREDIVSLHHSQEKGHGENVVLVDLAENVVFDQDRARRNFLATSSCGLCGKTTIESIRARGVNRPNPELRIEPDVLCRLPAALRSAQALFERTGGLHAAAVFNARGELLAVREDVGRHNAVDKIVGWALLEGHLPLSERLLLVSGRGGFEIVKKALVAGLSVVASISAASSLAVQLAREMGLTLVGFLRGERFLLYAGEERLQPLQPVQGGGCEPAVQSA
jgi:FdhD protein